MRVGCVLLTHLRAKVEVRRHPHLKESPVIIVARDPSATRSLVVDRFPAASGAAAGMTIQQAMSRHANAVVLDADEPHYYLVFKQILGSLQGISDRSRGPSWAPPTCDWTAWRDCTAAKLEPSQPC